MASWWENLTTPIEGGWQMGGVPTGGGPPSSSGLLAQNSQLYPWLGDVSTGLLAASAPSLAPQGGLGPRLGSAMGYASERQSKRQEDQLQNDVRRMALSQASDQRAAEAKLRDLMAAGGDPEAIKTAASAAYPEIYAKSLFPQQLDPVDRIKLLELEQTIKDKYAGSQTPSAATARAVGTLADVFDTAEKEGSPFAPGEAFSAQGLLSKAGISAPETVKGLPDAFLKPFGDPATIRRQAAQAILIEKETATISQNLTQLADKGTGRSATAINNLNTSLGAGNVPIPVRRKVILSTLETVIDDVQGRGVEVPSDWVTLRDRLRKQTEGITKGGEEGNAAYNTQGVQNNRIVAQPPPVYSPLPPAAAPAAAGPAAPTPPPRLHPSLPLNAQGVPSFTREADLLRAEQAGWLKGVKTIEYMGKTLDWVPE